MSWSSLKCKWGHSGKWRQDICRTLRRVSKSWIASWGLMSDETSVTAFCKLLGGYCWYWSWDKIDHIRRCKEVSLQDVVFLRCQDMTKWEVVMVTQNVCHVILQSKVQLVAKGGLNGVPHEHQGLNREGRQANTRLQMKLPATVLPLTLLMASGTQCTASSNVGLLGQSCPRVWGERYQ